MSWSERQRAMLAEMGIPLWFPEPAVDEAPATATERAASAAARPLAAPPAAHRDTPPPAAPAPAPARAERPSAPPPAPAGAAPVSVRVAPPQAAPTDAVVAVHRHRPAAAPSEVDTLDWPALREAVAACTACGLSGTRQQTVFGLGHAQAHWMIVGEAPGAEEDQRGEPFVGKSGELLDNMLRAIGLSRAEGSPDKQVYIANTLKCRPPGNRNPTAEELQQCEPFLNRQIALVQPRIILAMGRFAVQNLLRSDEPIGKLRGRVHTYQGVPLIVTYHPAYLLRQPLDKAKAWDDLCLAALTLAEQAAR